MQIAQISDGVIKAVQNIQLKPVYDGGRWWDLRGSLVLHEWMQQFGWQEVVDVPRPSDTETTVYENRNVELVDGVPTEVWVGRPRTLEELAAQAAAVERESTRLIVKGIITDLKAEKDRAQSVIDNANATGREKDLGRACKRIADAAIDLARFVRDM